MTRLVFGVFSLLVILVCCPAEGHAQGSFFGLANPGIYSHDPTGLEFPEVSQNRLTYDPAPVLEYGIGVSRPRSGVFEQLFDASTDLRLSLREPMMYEPCRYGPLEVSLVGSYTYSDWDAESGTFATQVGGPTVRISDLGTHIFGLGPEVRWWIVGPGDRSWKGFLSLRGEGTGGTAHPSIDTLPGAGSFHREVIIKPGRDPGETEPLWGYRLELSATFEAQNGIALSGIFGGGTIRTKLVTDVEENSDFIYWMARLEIPLDFLCSPRCESPHPPKRREWRPLPKIPGLGRLFD